MRERFTSEARIEFLPEGLVLGNAPFARIKPRVTCEFRRFECRNQSLPELLERREVQSDEPRIGGVQDVGLREARSIGGARRLPERKESGEGLDGEMCHRLEHRHFEVTATTATPSLHQGAENSLRGVEPCDGIRERRPEELWTAVVDNHTQKSAQGLRHGVIARVSRIGTGRTEAADGAIDESRIEFE